LLAFEVGGTSAALPSVASFADLSAENARAVVAAGGALITPELAEADSDGAFGATIAAGLCSGVCAKLGAAVRHAAPITVADRAAMTIRGLIQGLLCRKVLILDGSLVGTASVALLSPAAIDRGRVPGFGRSLHDDPYCRKGGT
jgi:hypothetical protein